MEKYYGEEDDFNLRLVVIFTGDVKSAEAVFETNCLSLRMEQAFLSHIDGEEAFQFIREKVNSGQSLEDDDLMKLVVLPLTVPGMEGKQPTDTTTLIPFLKDAEEHLKFKYKNITADAGYESEENYVFLEANGQLSYIKPANYEVSKTRKYRKDIGKIENMEYDAGSDIYICRNAKRLMADHVRHSKSRTGYVSEKTIYKCEDCSGCPYKAECIKGNNCKTPLEERTKTLQAARTFLKYRQKNLERILSDEGIVFRINRSIQAEGSFWDLKQDMQFRRYISKGTSNVLAESVLLAMAKNINKLHNKIQKGRTGTHLFPVKSV